ncbi:MAG: uracil-DNA glycosylase [Desulfurellales bacterium]|nr:MAG: uracil-DNA glycosylase [Desulfurellales bacterium]
MRFDTWAEFLEHQRRQPYMRQISEAVQHDRLLGPVYPRPEDVFRFTETPLRDVKVIILGQDPYHGPGQADGLAFSVREGVGLPPSLRNILRELDDDYFELIRQVVRQASGHVNRNGDYLVFDGVTGLPNLPTSGDLTPWTRQGVLLLNTTLTVRRGEAGSHCDIWQPFTDEVIRAVCDSAAYQPHFILWGSKARAALMRACDRRLLIGLPDDNGITFTTLRGRRVTFTHSAHPSPLSANKGFFGSRPFSRANTALLLNNPGCSAVDWKLS